MDFKLHSSVRAAGLLTPKQRIMENSIGKKNCQKVGITTFPLEILDPPLGTRTVITMNASRGWARIELDQWNYNGFPSSSPHVLYSIDLLFPG